MTEKVGESEGVVEGEEDTEREPVWVGVKEVEGERVSDTVGEKVLAAVKVRVPEMEVEEVPEGDFLAVSVCEVVPLWVCPTRDTVEMTVRELLTELVTDKEGEREVLPLKLGLTLEDTESELIAVLDGQAEVVCV